MNLLLRRLCTALIVLLTIAGDSSAWAQMQNLGDGLSGHPVKADHLTAELVSLAPGVSPGGSVEAGLVITLADKWHVYWVNAGFAGYPPSIAWTLPTGITAGPMQFPIPQRLPLGPRMDFGYEDLVAFPVRISAAAGMKPGPVHLDAQVTWLVCREQCFPGKAHLGLDLNVQPNSPAGQPVGALGTALTLLPTPLPPEDKISVVGSATEFGITLTTGDREPDLEFFPYEEGIVVDEAAQTAEPTATGVRLRVKRSDDLKTLPATLHGLLKLSDKVAYEVTSPVTAGQLPAMTMPRTGSTSELTVVSAVGLALLGGILLNLMPCVFPVLFLKGLALVQSSGEERKRLRSHGLVYTLGILVSFWIIVGVLLVLRAGGSQAGWGFQLQSPTFVLVLASGLFFFALSLAGQFDLGLSLTGAGGELAQKQGYAGSFFTGVLATVVATPCTAPLMGAAIGFALAQPAGVTFAVFTALGLGLALPYLLLSFQPSWTRILPKPGAWMEVLKQLTALPLFATVIWLTWVYGQLFASSTSAGVDHIERLLFCFLVLAVAGWVLGRWPLGWRSGVGAAVLAACALLIPLREPRKETLNWQPYSQAALDAARAAGHPVFIDFTAAWCLSCQVNEKAVLQTAEVEHQLTDRKFTLLRADWTRFDPEITKQLALLGRSGVPTYVIYPGSPSSQGDVLPELLSKQKVLDAIEQDAK